MKTIIHQTPVIKTDGYYVTIEVTADSYGKTSLHQVLGPFQESEHKDLLELLDIIHECINKEESRDYPNIKGFLKWFGLNESNKHPKGCILEIGYTEDYLPIMGYELTYWRNGIQYHCVVL